MAEEKNFEIRVKNYLKSKGAYIIKIWGGGFQTSGIPDLIVCYKGLFIAIELKSEKGIVSDLQKIHLSKIRESNGLSYVLRPSDFEDFKNFIELL